MHISLPDAAYIYRIGDGNRRNLIDLRVFRIGDDPIHIQMQLFSAVLVNPQGIGIFGIFPVIRIRGDLHENFQMRIPMFEVL